MSDIQFKFLKEKPLETNEEISSSKFGHEEIASTLEKIAEKCPTPFTIGLFAKWGSGKSTIANSLRKRLYSKNIPVILFDVWKHEGDALRRTFLKELDMQLRGKDYGNDFFSAEFKLNDRLQRSQSTNSDTKLKINQERINQFKPLAIAILVVLGIIASVLSYFNLLSIILGFFKTYILLFAGVTTGGAFLIWLLKQSVYFFTTETTSYGIDKFEDPHEFEDEFGNILKALQHPRIVIVFDNLDRVTHDKVAEVLSTIKTFLEPKDLEDNNKEVVFLVPCDSKSIKHHLANLYGSSDKFTFDSDEFLRKFFNTIIWIPDFIPVELETLAKDSLHETGVTELDNNYVAWLITKAFRDNPRQIIQFVNILLANYLLILERQGDDKDFPANFLKDNISQLTKYLILNQLFSDEMEQLRQKKVLRLLDRSTVVSDINDGNAISNDKNSEFLSFIDETKNIPIQNLRIFFSLRRSEQEKKFPGFESFTTMLEDRKIQEAQEYLNRMGDLSDSQLVNNFAQAIKTEIESKTNPVSLANLISTLFTIISENKISMPGTLLQEVYIILNGTCLEQLHLVSPKSVNEILFRSYSSYRSNLIGQWIFIMHGMVGKDSRYPNDRAFIDEVFDVLTDNPSYLNSEHSRKIQQFLESNYAGDIKIAAMVVRSEESQSRISSSIYAQKFMDSFAVDKTIETSKKVEQFNKFIKIIINPIGSDAIFEKFTNIISFQNQKTDFDTGERKDLIRSISGFLEVHLEWMKMSSEPNRISFIDSLIAFYETLPTIEEWSDIVSVLFVAMKYCPDQKIRDVNVQLNKYISNVNSDNFNEAYSILNEEEKSQFFSSIYGIYETAMARSIIDEIFRIEFYRKISDSQKQEFIEKIFQQNIEGALEFIENLNQVENKHIFPIFDKLWVIYDSASANHKSRILDFVNSRKAGSDAHVRDVLAEKIINCLISFESGYQEIGLKSLVGASAHLAQHKLRHIAKNVFDWIRKPEILPKYQPYSIRGILTQNTYFNDQEKAEFVQFVFDELIRKPSEVTSISFGFEILEQLNPTYEDRINNFDDVKIRIDNEQDENIRNALINGLIKLKPNKYYKENNDYWSSIDEISGI